MQSRDDLLSLIPTNTDHPTGQPSALPTGHPTGQPTQPSGQPSGQPTGQPTGQPSNPSMALSTSAPSHVSSSVTAIQNEGLACIAMAASIPALQTLTGACKLGVR